MKLSGFEVIPCVSKAELEGGLLRKLARMHSLGCNGEASNHSLHACMRRSSLVASRMQRDHISLAAGRRNRTKPLEPGF
jgi:hypothetical protein